MTRAFRILILYKMPYLEETKQKWDLGGSNFFESSAKDIKDPWS